MDRQGARAAEGNPGTAAGSTPDPAASPAPSPASGTVATSGAAIEGTGSAGGEATLGTTPSAPSDPSTHSTQSDPSALSNASTPSTAASPATAASSSTGSGTSTPSGGSSTGPTATPGPSGRPPPDRVRTNIKVAGVVMAIIGALLALQGYQAASLSDLHITDAQAQSAANATGGWIVLDVVGGPQANVTVKALNGTVLENRTTDAAGHLEFISPRAAVRLEVRHGDSVFTRNVVTLALGPSQVRIDPATAALEDPAWTQPDLSWLRIFWALLAAGLFMIVAGVMAFRMRGPRIAMAGAVVFVLVGVAFAFWYSSISGFDLRALFDPLLKITMGGFAVWAIRKGWDRFQPVRIGSVDL